MQPTLEEVRANREIEAQKFEDPNTQALVAKLMDSENKKIAKMARNYFIGLLTYAEFESYCKLLILSGERY